MGSVPEPVRQPFERTTSAGRRHKLASCVCVCVCVVTAQVTDLECGGMAVVVKRERGECAGMAVEQ